MDDQAAANMEQKGRPAGGTEQSLCRAVPGGTGIAVLAILLKKDPGASNLQNSLHQLQKSHPILRSRIVNRDDNTFFFDVSPIPLLQIQSFDISTTSQLLQNPNIDHNISPFHRILEHELNQNPWSDSEGTAVLFANHYALPDSKWVVTLRLHLSVCDRTSAVFLLKELLQLVRGKEDEDVEKKEEKEEFINLGIEKLIPDGKANKPFWARGVDLLGYSLNAMRFSNLDFKDVTSPRSSQVVRLQMNPDETDRILKECKVRGIKLCGAIAAAGLIAAHSLKHLPDHQWEKYAVITLIDCRKLLDPPIQSHDLGFYHSAILNTHDVKGEGGEIWELASRCYGSLRDSINGNKHFTDMADLNLLMCKAIDNPGMTPHSSLRTSLICVFEDPVIDDEDEATQQLHQWMGLEDYMGSASVHGVGPSIAVFDTIRNGRLDCTFVYPSPLHSREQIQELIDAMKRILLSGGD